MVAHPVIPATNGAEAEEWLEPRRQRLQLAKILPLHSSLGDKARPIQKIKKKLDMRSHHVAQAGLKLLAS